MSKKSIRFPSTQKDVSLTHQKPKPNAFSQQEQNEGESVPFHVKPSAMIDNVTYTLESQNSPVSLPPEVQTQLTIGEPGDKYEREADRVAKETVQRLYDKTGATGGEGNSPRDDGKNIRLKPLPYTVQRDGGESQSASNELSQKIFRAKSGGMELPGRDRYENAMGANFSSVKIHTGSESNMLNRQLSARAFTNQNHIFFKQGEFNPGTRSGDALISHELTHVMQQNPDTVNRKVERSTPQISRAPEDWIQRDALKDAYLEYLEPAGKKTRLFGRFGQKSKSFNIVAELIAAYNKSQDNIETSYVCLKKIEDILVVKQERNKGKKNGVFEAINQFRRKTKFRPLLRQKATEYSEYLSQKQNPSSKQKKGNEDPSHRTEMLAHLDSFEDPDLPKKYTGLSQKYDDLIENKVKVGWSLFKKVGNLAEQKKMSTRVKEFQKISDKGSLRQRGKILRQVDTFLAATDMSYERSKKAKTDKEVEKYEQEMRFHMHSATKQIDIWLRKYKPDYDAILAGESEDNYGMSFLKVYQQILGYQNKLLSDFPVLKQDIGTLPGQVPTTNSVVLQKLRQQQVTKKLKKNFKGDCGKFFGWFLPNVFSVLAPSPGTDGEVAIEAKIPLAGASKIVAGYIAIGGEAEAEYKDKNKLKTKCSFIITPSIKAGSKLGDEVGASLEAEAKIPIKSWTEVEAKDAKLCAKLTSYGTYQRLLNASSFPALLVNLLFGGSASRSGRRKAEDWAASVEETTWGHEGDKASQGAYVETGTGIGGEVSAKATLNADKRNEFGMSGKAGASKSWGRRYDKKGLMESKGMTDKGYSTGKMKDKGSKTARVETKAELGFSTTHGNYKVKAGSKSERRQHPHHDKKLYEHKREVKVTISVGKSMNPFAGKSLIQGGGEVWDNIILGLASSTTAMGTLRSMCDEDKSTGSQQYAGNVQQILLLLAGSLGQLRSSNDKYEMSTDGGGQIYIKFVKKFDPPQKNGKKGKAKHEAEFHLQSFVANEHGWDDQGWMKGLGLFKQGGLSLEYEFIKRLISAKYKGGKWSFRKLGHEKLSKSKEKKKKDKQGKEKQKDSPDK